MSGPWIAAFVVLAISNLCMLAVLMGLVRRVLPVLEQHTGTATAHPPGPRTGERIAGFAGVTADGRTVRAEEIARGPAVLLFVDHACATCADLLDGLRATGVTLDAAWLYTVAGEGTDLGDLPDGPNCLPLRQDDGAIAGALGIPLLPAAVALHDGVVLGWEPSATPGDVQRLVDRAEAEAAGARPAGARQG